MLLLNRFGKFRIVVYPLTLSLLSCAAPVSNKQSKKPETITVEQAQEFFTTGHKARFSNEFGRFYDSIIIGWDETGFIGVSYGRVDTISYYAITNVIEIETSVRQTNKGAGVGCGIGLCASAFIWAIAIDDYKHSNSSLKDMSIIGALALSLIVTFGATMLGTAIGTTSYKYDKYYFNKDDFKTNPWQVPFDDQKNSKDTTMG
jgi:hypothetical protein